MPKIEDILGDGGKFSDTQLRVLEILDSHPGYLFRTAPEDLSQIRMWAGDPQAPEPPKGSPALSPLHIKGIKSSLKVLRKEGKIACIEVHHERYYGSHEAVQRARTAFAKVPV